MRFLFASLFSAISLLGGGVSAQAPADTIATKVVEKTAVENFGRAIKAAPSRAVPATPRRLTVQEEVIRVTPHVAAKAPAVAKVVSPSPKLATKAVETNTDDPTMVGFGKDNGKMSAAIQSSNANFDDVIGGGSHPPYAAMGAKATSAGSPSDIPNKTDVASPLTDEKAKAPTKVVAPAEVAEKVDETKVDVAVAKPHIGKPFIFPGAESKKRLVDAIITCDRRVLIVNCRDLVPEANRDWSENFKSRAELANYLNAGEEKLCPVGRARLSRVLGDRVKANDTWERAYRPGSMCIWIDNRPMVSLDCGNFVKHFERAVADAARVAVKEEPRKPPVQLMPSKKDTLVIIHKNLGSSLNDYQPSLWVRIRYPFWGVTILGGVVTAACIHYGCFSQETRVNVP